MRAVKLFQHVNGIRTFRPFWDSSQTKKFGGSSLVTKKQEIAEPDPYEGNSSFTDCDQYAKVTVIGAAGRVGRTLSLLLKTCPLIDSLCLFDLDKSVKGVGVDISHIDTKCCVDSICGMRNIQQALDAPDVVVIAAGCPTSPHLSGTKLFEKNAPIVAGLSEACARFCPKACVVLITNPINSLLPVVGEIYQLVNNQVPEKKLFGLTTLDVVRANTFVAEVVRKDPNSVIVPVIGGTSQETIVPVISQMKPCCKIKRGEMIALTECVKRAEGNLADCQNCGTRGASTLSTAYAAFRFTSSLVMALKGATDVIECAFVKSDIIPELEYLASPLKLGIDGIEHNFGYPQLSDCAKKLGKAGVGGTHAYWMTNPSNSDSSRLMSIKSAALNRKYHTIRRRDIIRQENIYRKYILEDRKKTGQLTKRASNQSGRKRVKPKLKSCPWYSNNHNFKALNAMAKQKVKNFNAQRRLTPSASVMLSEEKFKKEKYYNIAIPAVIEQKKEEEKTKSLVEVKKECAKLLEQRRENEELKQKIISLVENKNPEAALQMQQENLELEATKLRACWLILTSTVDSFRDFCQKYLSQTEPSIVEAVKEGQEKQELEEEAETEADAEAETEVESPKEAKKRKYQEKYSEFLEKLLKDEEECDKEREYFRK